MMASFLLVDSRISSPTKSGSGLALVHRTLNVGRHSSLPFLLLRREKLFPLSFEIP